MSVDTDDGRATSLVDTDNGRGGGGGGAGAAAAADDAAAAAAGGAFGPRIASLSQKTAALLQLFNTIVSTHPTSSSTPHAWRAEWSGLKQAPQRQEGSRADHLQQGRRHTNQDLLLTPIVQKEGPRWRCMFCGHTSFAKNPKRVTGMDRLLTTSNLVKVERMCGEDTTLAALVLLARRMTFCTALVEMLEPSGSQVQSSASSSAAQAASAAARPR